MVQTTQKPSVRHARTEGVRELPNERDSPDNSHPVSAEPSTTGTVGSHSLGSLHESDMPTLSFKAFAAYLAWFPMLGLWFGGA